LLGALCGASLALAAITPARAAEAMRGPAVRPPEPIQRRYEDVNCIARHATVAQQWEVRLAALRAPGSRPPLHLGEIGERIARVDAAIAEVDPASFACGCRWSATHPRKSSTSRQPRRS
jgi:hypothetical protein